MEAMSQQLQSDLCVAAAKDQPQHRPLLPKLDILAVDPDEELQEEWEAEDDVKGGPLDPHEVKHAVCVGHWRCTSTPPERRHGREQDATQLASSGSIATKEASKPHVTVRVWYVRRFTIKESSRSSRQDFRWKLCESYSVLRVRKTCFELRTLF